MATVDFFSTVKKSFADVPVDKDNNNAIDTTSFLEASESLTKLFDVLGSVAFKPVKSDILGNVEKVRARQLAAPAESTTLQSLVLTELGGKSHTATEGLLWLTRGLDFTAQALRHNMDNSSKELADSFREAYGNTLKPHHGFLIKPIFNAAMSATPYRKDFYEKLGPDQAVVRVELEKWLVGLEERLAILKAFITSKQAQWK